MKKFFTWNNMLLLAFTIFAIGMGTLVRSCFNSKIDLVSDQYYEDELVYQDLIDGSARAFAGGTNIYVEHQDSTVVIRYVGFDNIDSIKGECFFYYAPDSKFDYHTQLKPGLGFRQTVEPRLHPGEYKVRIKWTRSGSFYYQEQEFNVL